MTKRNDGGPVFPAYTGNPDHWQFGMSLRDWFAGQAMIALAGDSQWELMVDTAQKNFAATAYEIADAMIEARGK